MSTTLAQPSTNGEAKKVSIEFKGDKFLVPEGMDYADAIQQLKRQEGEDDTLVNISEKVHCFPLDGAVAMTKALQQKYGWTNLEAKPTFFGPQPPTLIGVEIGFDKTLQTPWGCMSVPKIDGTLEAGYAMDDGMPCFVLKGSVKRKHEKQVAEIAKTIREIVKVESIYRGKAIRINFRDCDGYRREFDAQFGPRFIDMSEAHTQEPIYSAAIEQAIDINLFNPIRYTERCRENGIPLKRGILLGGPYGTGKTLTAWKTAIQCVEQGWTFLLLEDVRDLDLAIGFAKLYAPCVLFAEDVDRVAGPSRDSHTDRILNTLDGVTSKNLEVMVVVTTNRMGAIHPAFLRPGRIDKVIEVLPPDLDAMLRLVRKYGLDKQGESLLSGTDDDFKKALAALVGANASFVREVVEQSKLSAIARAGKLQITAADLEIAVKATLPHIRMLNPEHGKKPMTDEGTIEVPPLQMAGEIIIHKLAEVFLRLIGNPMSLDKVLVQMQQRPKGPGLGPSKN